MILPVGIHNGVSWRDYEAVDGIGSTRLGWLAESPLYYRHMCGQPPVSTPALDLGTAVHMAVLEPERFEAAYAIEPDPEQIAPLNAKPRATNAYRDAVRAIEADGFKVLRKEDMEQVRHMAAAVRTHPKAARLLSRAPVREATMVWNHEDGRLLRARADLLGAGVLADLKTTRDLAKFSPWGLYDLGYHIQAAHYLDGVAHVCEPVKLFYFVVVESSAPYDVGVFSADESLIDFGRKKRDHLLRRLAECERTDTWPGRFPEVETAVLPTSAMSEMDSFEEVA